MPNNHNGDLTMSGISYWNNKDGDTIKEKILELINQNCFQNQFWDNIILSNLNLFSIKVIEISDIYEIDTIEDIIHINNNILDQK